MVGDRNDLIKVTSRRVPQETGENREEPLSGYQMPGRKSLMEV
jgi:hypothetical protein